MTPPGLPPDGLPDAWERLRAPSLLEAIANRRSRRFALGMELNGGPFAYRSRHAPIPLTPGEEAVLAFAAAGLTGFVLGELPYASGGKPEAGSGTANYGSAKKGQCRRRFDPRMARMSANQIGGRGRPAFTFALIRAIRG